MMVNANRVTLRDVTDADLPIFYLHQLDPDANWLVGFVPRDAEAFAAHWSKIRTDAATVIRTILSDGVVAGYAVCFERLGEREVGYWLGREFWGRGIASRAVPQFLRHVAIRPLCARVAKHNPASLRVLLKSGFLITHEGTFTSGDGEELEEFVLTLAV
jgi:RimJ/RimL family protein N-acetyltransferase